jgi:hypothetical protein
MELICRRKSSVKAYARLGEYVTGRDGSEAGHDGWRSGRYRQTCLRMILPYRDQDNHEGVSEGGHSRQVLQSEDGTCSAATTVRFFIIIVHLTTYGGMYTSLGYFIFLINHWHVYIEEIREHRKIKFARWFSRIVHGIYTSTFLG